MVTGWDSIAQVVDRPKLREALDGLLSQPLTLLIAQAGAGKSVLLRQWMEHHPELAFVRLDVDPRDDDPVRFATHLAAGIPSLRPSITLVQQHVSSCRRGLGPEFIQAISAAVSDAPPTVIVVDDLHRIRDHGIADDIVSLAARLPRHVRLVISSRVPPPLRWARQARDERAIELRTGDLVFDRGDAETLLNGIAGRAVDQRAVTDLLAMTEGWPEGLHLAALALREQDDDVAFVERFDGTEPLISGYFDRQVLAAQPASLRSQLLQASALDELNQDLLSAAIGDKQFAHLLGPQERESLFVLPLKGRPEWFRFHHLFSTYLRDRLHVDSPVTETGVLQRAARWHLAHGQIDRAIVYLLRARDWDALLDVFRARGAELYERGALNAVIQRMGEVPATVANRLDASLLLGVLRSLEGELALADGLLRRVMGRPVESWGEPEMVEGAGPGSATASALLVLGRARFLDTRISVHAQPGVGSPSLPQSVDRASNEKGAEVVPALLEPLTRREREILDLLPTRATNPEIAALFFVSVNTIKTHTVHIYRKLGVPNRNAAIVRAHEIGLLSEPRGITRSE